MVYVDLNSCDLRTTAKALNHTLKLVFGGDAGEGSGIDQVHVGLRDDQILEVLPDHEEFARLIVSDYSMSIGGDLLITPFLGEGNKHSLYTIHWRMSEGHLSEYEDVEIQDLKSYHDLKEALIKRVAVKRIYRLSSYPCPDEDGETNKETS